MEGCSWVGWGGGLGGAFKIDFKVILSERVGLTLGSYFYFSCVGAYMT